MTQPIKTPTSVAEQLKGIRRTGLLSLVVMLVIGGVFYTSTTSTDDNFAEQRRTARIGACAQAQGDAHREVESAGALAQNFSDVVTATIERTAELEDQIKAFVESQRMAAAKANPLRDCTPAGIDAYYDNAPPVEPCPFGGNGKGYCK